MAKKQAGGEASSGNGAHGMSRGTEPAESSTPGADQVAAAPQLNVIGQYIKDLSFESPHGPSASAGQNPELQVSVNVHAEPRAEEQFEVALKLDVHARSESGVIYNVELVYGGLFRLRNVPQNMLQPVLFVDCPTLLFPFVRRVLADLTRDGGYPPLMLDPLDFGRLYAQNLARGQETASADRPLS